MNTDINNDTLTLDELDTLARAYLDCRLSKLEEKELQLVLSASALSSPAIDQARECMGVTTVMESLAATPAPRRIRRRPSWLKWAAAAACVALAIGIKVNFRPSDSHGGDYVAVYIDGQPLTGDEALAKAIETRDQCLSMLDLTMARATEAQNNSTKNLNHHTH